MVENERVDIRQLERELTHMKQMTINSGLQYDSDFDDLLAYGNAKRYRHKYQALGGSHRPSMALQLVPWNEDPFLGQGPPREYEKSKWKSMESLSSLDSSRGFSYRGTEDGTGGDSGYTRDSEDPERSYYQKLEATDTNNYKQNTNRALPKENEQDSDSNLDNDSASEYDGSSSKYPKMYDPKRDKPPFIRN